jgi:hypothetical protein
MRSGAGYTKSNQSAINSTLGGTPHVVGGDGPPSFPRGRSKEEKDHRREKTKPHHAAEQTMTPQVSFPGRTVLQELIRQPRVER